MTAPAAPTTGPTPGDMPGAKPGDEAGAEQNDGDGADEGEGELAPEELAADRDKWKTQAKRNEARAKSNAQKAKDYDANAAVWKAAYDREQAERNKTKTPEQLKAEADAEADRKVALADEARQEAEANLLRYQLADGVPPWAVSLLTGTTAEEITDQVEELKGHLTAYVTEQIGDSNPRRPAPNPLAGRGGDSGAPDARAQFGAAFSKLLGP